MLKSSAATTMPFIPKSRRYRKPINLPGEKSLTLTVNLTILTNILTIIQNNKLLTKRLEKIPHPSKFDNKKGVSFRSSHFITIHLLLCCNPLLLFFVHFRTFIYPFIIIFPICISKLLADFPYQTIVFIPLFFSYVERLITFTHLDKYSYTPKNR